MLRGLDSHAPVRDDRRGTMTGSTTLSILAVSLNEAAHIARLMASIHALQRPPHVALETILIDGGSGDGTVAEARKAGFDRILESPGASIPVCRNQGANAATGSWIAYLDADCEPATDWLEQAIPFLEGGESMVIGWPVSPPSPGTWVQRAWHMHWAQRNRARESWKGRPVARYAAFRVLTARNMIMHHEVFDRVGGFDENLPTGEDTDFAFRACNNRDIVVLGVPALRVVHHGEPETLRAFYRQQLWHANRTSYATILRERKGCSGANAPLFTVLYLATLIFALAGIVAAAVVRGPVPLLAVVPFGGLLVGPATVIARRARSYRTLPALVLLYAAYGFARMLDLVGLYRNKKSWKAPAITS